jgi:hypothetical protein
MKQSGLLLLVLAVIVSGAAWAGDGVVALQTADPSCKDDSGRIYVDCGNGTVTDNRTGLVWLKRANCFGMVTWYEAMGIVAGLSDLPENGRSCATYTSVECDCGLQDGSSPGDWRLPSVGEWEAMFADALGDGGDPDCTPDDGLPAITSDWGTQCWSLSCVILGGCSFVAIQDAEYWSATSQTQNRTHAFSPIVDTGYLLQGNTKTLPSGYVWPVRGGQ